MIDDTLDGDGLVGQTIVGRYEIVRHLGSGGMGAVYQARQLSMDRPVALKLLHVHYATNKQAVARFNREMQVTAKIEHPNTIRVYDYGQTEAGQLFLAVEFLEGSTLSDALTSRDPISRQRLVNIGLQIAKALAAAHHDGVVHRDLKPDNVMLLERYGEKDFVKVLDFGIARLMDNEERTQLTQEGAVVGTPAYMSPEQATGAPLDHRTDLYSLGVILFHMATGRAPFDAPTTISLMVKHVQDPPPRPSDLVPGLVPDALEALILQMLAKDPAARPQSAQEVISALEKLAGPAPHLLAADTRVSSPADQGPGRSAAMPARAGRAGHKRRATPLLLLGVVALILAGVAAFLVTKSGEGPGGMNADAVAGTSARPDAGTEAEVAGGSATAGVDSAMALADATAANPPDRGDAARSPDSAAARDALTEHLSAAGDPAAPLRCQTDDRALIATLAKAAGLLAGGRVGGARSQDVEALSLLDAAHQVGSRSAEYWTLVARARLYAKRPAAHSLEAAAKAVALCADHPMAHNAVGNAHHYAKQADLARGAYRKALALDPDYAAPRFNLGLIALRDKDLDGAATALSELLKLHPAHPRAHLVRGQVRLTQGSWELAVADLIEATRRKPESDIAWLLLGQARLKRGDDGALVNDAFCRAKRLGNKAAVAHCRQE